MTTPPLKKKKPGRDPGYPVLPDKPPPFGIAGKGAGRPTVWDARLAPLRSRAHVWHKLGSLNPKQVNVTDVKQGRVGATILPGEFDVRVYDGAVWAMYLGTERPTPTTVLASFYEHEWTGETIPQPFLDGLRDRLRQFDGFVDPTSDQP